MVTYRLEDIVNHLHVEGIKGVRPVITDYDWDDKAREEDRVRITIFLQREDTK